MGIRQRKNALILALQTKKIAHKLTDEQVARFEVMYRRAKTEAEQDQVTAAIESFTSGWKENSDAYSRLLRDVNDFGDDPVLGEEDEDPPALKAALERSRVTFVR